MWRPSLLTAAVACCVAALGCRPATERPRGAVPAAACRAEDEVGRDLRERVAQYAAAADSLWAATRDSLRYPSVPEAAVALVGDQRVCGAAAAALARALAAPRPARPPSGRVYVVRAGATYTVHDPAYCYTTACLAVYVVFDDRWRRLSLY